MQLQKGVWCGFRGSWSASYSKIKYDKLLHSSTNMVNVGVPLDTQSGIALALAHCLCIDRHPMDRHPKDRHPIDSTL